MMSYDRKNPYITSVTARYCLNKPGSAKNVQHVVLDLADSGVSYEPGDSLAIFPVHSDALLQRTLEALGASGDETVTDSRSGQTVSLRHLLRECRNITRLQKKTVKLLAEYDSELGPLLEAEGRAGLSDYLDSHELWDAAAGKQLDLQALADALPPLLPRFYSIASSQAFVGEEVHLCIGVVAYETRGVPRRGVCSHYLCEDVPLQERSVRLYVQPAPKFRLPEDPSLPVIMIGPGTGVAPFRAFVQERLRVGASGANWLFFGDQHRATDYLYEEEFTRWEQEGKLQIDLAFSRDQATKVYVQDRLAERADAIWSWLEDGAHIYLCGDANSMAPSVEAVLTRIAEEHGADASTFLRELRKAGRYHKDVY